MQTVFLQAPPNEDEAAAVLAAITCVLQQQLNEAPADTAQRRPVWRTAALLETQGHTPSRGADHAAWGRVARAGRSRRWSKGIV